MPYATRLFAVALLVCASTLLALAPARAQTACPQPTFQRAPGGLPPVPGTFGFSSFAVGDSPISATVADFDGDGQLDIATANLGGDSVSINYGNTNPVDGNFNQRPRLDIAMPASPQSNGSRPYGIAHGRMNNDAFEDLVVVNRNSATVVVLLGDGAGGFSQLPPVATLGSFAYFPALADFNGDGRLDVAVTLFNSNSVRVLLNDGNGQLTLSPQALTGISAPIGIVAADMISGSAIDLAVVALGTDQIHIYPGSGNGSFGNRITLNPVLDAAAGPISLELHDMDNDGHGDLVVSVRVSRSNANDPILPFNRVAIFHALPTGGFETTPLSVQAGVDLIHATAADFNRDGVLDLLSTSSAFTFSGNVALNTGPRSYASAIGHAAAGNPFFGVTGDFSRNGYPDFAIVNQPTNTVTVYINQCPPIDATTTIGGHVSGLLGSGLVLRNNGGDDLPISADGPFSFPTRLRPGAAYTVTVASQPGVPEQLCSVSNGSGTAPDGEVNDVQINCQTRQFSVGGVVSGLLGSGLRLQNNGGDDLVVASDGPFVFATPLDDLSNFSISVAAQPQAPRQTCVATPSSGMLAGAPVDTIALSCTTDDVVVSPSSGPGGSIAPATPQAVAYQSTTSFTLGAESNFQLFAVSGSCGGSLNGLIYTTAPLEADCTVEASFRPLTDTVVVPPAQPLRQGQSALLTVDVNGLAGGAPQGGAVQISLSSGEQCIDNGPPSVSGNIARFSCTLIPGVLGNVQAQASYAGSTSHFDSNSDPQAVAVRRYADLSVTVDDGQTAALPGANAQYLLSVHNTGPDEAAATSVVLAAAPALLNAQWSCTASGGAACPASSGVGELSLLVDLPVGGGLDLLQTGQWPQQLPSSTVVQAQVSPAPGDPNWVHDPQPSNNASTDVNVVEGVFADSFESP